MKIAGKSIEGMTFGIFGFIVLLVAYYFGSRTGKSKAMAAAGDTLAKDITKSDLTYDLSQYVIMADRCYDAMYDIGTDEEALYIVFAKMRTNSDLLQLIKAFGSRGNIVFQGGAKNLAEWIASDLNNVEIEKVNDILKRNNITYQF